MRPRQHSLPHAHSNLKLLPQRALETPPLDSPEAVLEDGPSTRDATLDSEADPIDAQDAPLDDPSTDDAPRDDPSTDDAPLDAPRTEDAPVDGPSTEHAPVDGPSTEDAPVDGPSTEDAQLDGQSPDDESGSSPSREDGGPNPVGEDEDGLLAQGGTTSRVPWEPESEAEADTMIGRLRERRGQTSVREVFPAAPRGRRTRFTRTSRSSHPSIFTSRDGAALTLVSLLREFTQATYASPEGGEGRVLRSLLAGECDLLGHPVNRARSAAVVVAPAARRGRGRPPRAQQVDPGPRKRRVTETRSRDGITTEGRCCRCGAAETPQWRYIHKERFCNACYMRAKRWVDANLPGRKLPPRMKVDCSQEQDERLSEIAAELVEAAFTGLHQQ